MENAWHPPMRPVFLAGPHTAYLHDNLIPSGSLNHMFLSFFFFSLLCLVLDIAAATEPGARPAAVHRPPRTVVAYHFSLIFSIDLTAKELRSCGG
jgi:hypothetical protein